jgi:hypothetical protein
MDSTSETRLEGCHPILIARLHQLEALLDFPLEIVQGNRTFNLQAALFAQGRESLDSVNNRRLAVGLAPITEEENQKIVTKAPPGHGWHEFACAADVAPLTPEHKIDWNVSHPNWQAILAKATSCGLAEGALWRTFPDNPHLYPQELPATPGDDIRAAWAAAGKAGVWSVLPEPLTIATS